MRMFVVVIFFSYCFFCSLSLASVSVDMHYTYSATENVDKFAKVYKHGGTSSFQDCSQNSNYSDNLAFPVQNYNSGKGSPNYWMSGIMDGAIETTLRKKGGNDLLRVRLHPYAIILDHDDGFSYYKGKAHGFSGTRCRAFISHLASKIEVVRQIKPDGNYGALKAYIRKHTYLKRNAKVAIALQVIDSKQHIVPGEYVGFVYNDPNILLTNTSTYATYREPLDRTNLNISLVVERAFDFHFYEKGVSIHYSNEDFAIGVVRFSSNTNVNTYLTMNCHGAGVDSSNDYCFIDQEKHLKLSSKVSFSSTGGSKHDLKFGQRFNITPVVTSSSPVFDHGELEFRVDGFDSAVKGRSYLTQIELIFEEGM